MTLTTGRRPTGFTLIELAVVIAIIFILVGSLVVVIPQIEVKVAVNKAKGDLQRLQLALGLYQESEGTLPPDRIGLFSPALTHTYTPQARELQSNILLIHHLTTRRTRRGYLQLKQEEVVQRGTLSRRVGDSLLVPTSVTTNVPAYAFLDPWRNPYVYDNNLLDGSTPAASPTTLLEGLPNHSNTFDLYSMGPNQKSAMPTQAGWRNGLDDDNDGSVDENDEAALNGEERTLDTTQLGDDLNNWQAQ